jgi:hypothetical protein
MILENKCNLEMFQGSTFSVNVTWKNADGTNKDLTGTTARMQIRSSYNSNVVVESLTSSNGEIVAYPYSQTDLDRDNPSTSFPAGVISPASLAEWSVFPVHYSDQPVVDILTQRMVEIAPVYDGQSWIQQWAVEVISQDEINANTAKQAASVRAERNSKLSETDWTQVYDAPVDKNAWADYRQALRDIPNQPGFPWNIDWPVKQ